MHTINLIFKSKFIFDHKIYICFNFYSNNWFEITGKSRSRAGTEKTILILAPVPLLCLQSSIILLISLFIFDFNYRNLK